MCLFTIYVCSIVIAYAKVRIYIVSYGFLSESPHHYLQLNILDPSPSPSTLQFPLWLTTPE